VSPPEDDPLRARFWHEIQAEAGNAAFHYDRLMEREPNNPEWPYRRAELYAKAGDLVRVEQQYDKAVALGMDSAALWSNRGFLYQKRNQWLKAEADFSRALTIVPDDGSIWYRRGTVRAEAGRWAVAGSDLDHALLLVGRRVDGQSSGVDWYEPAYAYLAAGEVARYRGLCTEELTRIAKERIEPDNALLRACCIIPGAVADYSQLLTWAKQAADRRPGDPPPPGREGFGPRAQPTRYEFGIVLYRGGKFAEAARELDQAAKMERDDVMGWLFLAMSRHQRGDLKGAQAMLDKTVKLRKENEATTPWLPRLQADLLLSELKKRGLNW
jgi:tetratricopeptide (TPR) repeat protein